jgi:hypothetical protein
LGGLAFLLGVVVEVVVVQLIVMIAILVDVHRSGRIRPISPLRWSWLSPVNGLAAGLFFLLMNSLPGMQTSSGLTALAGWLFYGLAFGLAVLVQHSVLRWQLRRSGVVPPHLHHFLEYAADRMLLRKVSGGYRFIHVLVREYFADLAAIEE